MFDDPQNQSAPTSGQAGGAASPPAQPPTMPVGNQSSAGSVDPEAAARQAEAEQRRAHLLASMPKTGPAKNPDGSVAGERESAEVPPVAAAPDVSVPPQPVGVPASQPVAPLTSAPGAPVPEPIVPAGAPPGVPEDQSSEQATDDSDPVDAQKDPFSDLARSAANPIQLTSDTALTDQEMADMFKRETLSPLQRILMMVVILVIVGLFVGGGIWLYSVLDPFSSEVNTDSGVGSEQSDATGDESVVADPDVPLHELDTDGDGLRDIDEKKYGTDIDVIDTDGDGHSDSSEVNNGYDPLDPNG